MNKLMGLIVILVGVAVLLAGLYLGIWVMFIGGIVDIVNQCKSEVTDGLVIGKAIAKIVFCGLVNYLAILAGGFVISLGGVVMADSKPSYRRFPL